MEEIDIKIKKIENFLKKATPFNVSPSTYFELEKLLQEYKQKKVGKNEK